MTEMPYLILCGSAYPVIYSSCNPYLCKPSQARIIIIIIIIIIINNLIPPFLEASKGALQLFTLVKTI